VTIGPKGSLRIGAVGAVGFVRCPELDSFGAWVEPDAIERLIVLVVQSKVNQVVVRKPSVAKTTTARERFSDLSRIKLRFRSA